MADSLIAGYVIRHYGILLTRYRRHFERVPGLTLSRQDYGSGATNGGMACRAPGFFRIAIS